MRLGTLETLREALGGRTPEGKLTIGHGYACALKRAAGLNGTKFFDVDAVVKWRKEHPNWKMTDVYPNKPTRQPSCNRRGRPAATADKSHER